MNKITLILMMASLNVSAFADPAVKKVVPKAKASVAAAASTEAKESPSMPLKNGKVEFFALGKPSMLKIHGASDKITGSMHKVSGGYQGKFTVPNDSFETGMGVRDTHLKEKIFESSKYPTSELVIDSLKIPEGKTGVMEQIPFSGTFKFHGVEKKVDGKADLIQSDKSLNFIAKFTVNLTDYQITPPEFMGMTIQNEVKIESKGDIVGQ